MKKFILVLASLLIALVIEIAIFPISKRFQKEISPLLNNEETKILSENIGHLLAENLKEYSPHYDLRIVINTIQKIENKAETLKPTATCQMALLDLNSKILKAETEQNLKSAESFLADLSKNEKVISVQKGKLYYEVIKEGKGTNITKESSPLFHFTETNLNGKIIRDTREEEKPIKIKLSETILGFSEAVAGMRIGERRKIYVHPDLAYGKLSRKQLSIFDVEILRN